MYERMDNERIYLVFFQNTKIKKISTIYKLGKKKNNKKQQTNSFHW